MNSADLENNCKCYYNLIICTTPLCYCLDGTRIVITFIFRSRLRCLINSNIGLSKCFYFYLVQFAMNCKIISIPTVSHLLQCITIVYAATYNKHIKVYIHCFNNLVLSIISHSITAIIVKHTYMFISFSFYSFFLFLNHYHKLYLLVQ